jgi:hypothetical protein
LYSVLNRTDIFADFTRVSSVGMQWETPASNDSIGIWNFLHQAIVAWELTTRLKNLGGGGFAGFTPRILATLIIADLWLKNVRIVLTDATVPIGALKKPETPAEKAKAEDFKKRGDEAWKRKDYQAASDLYTSGSAVGTGELGERRRRCLRSDTA